MRVELLAAIVTSWHMTWLGLGLGVGLGFGFGLGSRESSWHTSWRGHWLTSMHTRHGHALGLAHLDVH